MIPPTIQDLLRVEVAAPTVVFLLALVRLQFGSVVFAPRYAAIWNSIRRVATPILQRVIYQTAIPNVEIENHAVKAEYVGVVDLTTQHLISQLNTERDLEIPLLAGFKTDWDGNKESGTAVWYCGRKPALFPNWLRPYQVHIFTFRVGDQTRVCAHFEANPWRIDKAIDHLFKGESFSAPKGVQRTKRALRDANVRLHESDLSAVGA